MDRRRRLALALVTVAAVTMAAGCNRGGGHKGKRGAGGAGASAAPIAVATTEAKQLTVRPTLTIAGVIAPLQNVAITSALSEPALKVLVQEGDRVSKGETLAILDTSDLTAEYQSQIAAADSDDAKVSQARYNAQLQYGQNPEAVSQQAQAVRQAQQTLSLDQQNLTRDKQLAARGYIAQQTTDQQTTLVANDEAALRAAQAQLASSKITQTVNGSPTQGLQAATIQSAISDAASARAAAAQTQTSVAKAVIVSPVDGVVANRNLNPGEYPSGRTLFTVQEISSVYAELNASSAQVFALTRGAKVALKVSGAGNATYTGSVIGVLGQVTPGSTNFTVKTVVENPDLKLQSGVPVTAVVSLPPTAGVGVPSTAFLDDTHASVLVNAGGTAKTTNVREVATDGKNSVVLGLQSGQLVISDGQSGVVSGQKLSER